MLTFDEFYHRVLIELEIDAPEFPSPDSDLYNEMGVDSLQAFELIILTEGLANCLVPPAHLPEIYTMGDAFRYYLSLINEARAGEDLSSS
jgi:acyl carrier protein